VLPVDWFEEFPGAVTICDEAGIILALNARAAQGFASDGGKDLVGRQVLDCHPEPARSKLREMMASQRANVYTVEKGGVKKLIYQAPWTVEGRYAGFVEVALEVPNEMPHFVRSS